MDALLRLAVEPDPDPREASAPAQPRVEVADLHLHADGDAIAGGRLVDPRHGQPQEPLVAAVPGHEQPALDPPRDRAAALVYLVLRRAKAQQDQRSRHKHDGLMIAGVGHTDQAKGDPSDEAPVLLRRSAQEVPIQDP